MIDPIDFAYSIQCEKQGKIMSDNQEITTVVLPSVDNFSEPMLKNLTKTLGVSRDIFATNEQIVHVIENLPRLLVKYPQLHQNENFVKMCAAVASGLFDSAISYMWNASIIELRNKVRLFGVQVIPQIINEEFDEKTLMDLRDSRLLSLCRELNLISEQGFFILDHCRDIRNNFSAAHPAIGNLDEYNLIDFVNNCSRYALSTGPVSSGVDIKELISVINSEVIETQQLYYWCEQINRTFDAQRELIFNMLHGIYCDPGKKNHVYESVMRICKVSSANFTPSIISRFINQHQRYLGRGDKRYLTSQMFFENLGLVRSLSESERHSIISSACRELMEVHLGVDNISNEPRYAKRLKELSNDHQIPETVRNEFVETVVTCTIGDEYRSSHDAEQYYESMIKGFSSDEIELMLSLPKRDNVLSKRLNRAIRCKLKFKQIVGLLDEKSIPTIVRATFEEWLNLEL